MARRCASVAAFLQQAEENLALLHAKSGRRETALPPKNLSEHLRLATVGMNTSAEILGHSPKRTPSKDGKEWNVNNNNIELSPRQAYGASPTIISAKLSRPRGESVVDDPIRRLELREADAKEQMDIQAKMMLGVDRKIKAFDSRLCALEAGATAVVDVSSSCGASSSTLLESRLSVLEAVVHGPKVGSSLSPRGVGSFEKLVDASSTQDIMEVQRRIAALVEGARRDRESSRKYAKGLIEEFSDSFRQLLEDMERRTLEREDRFGEEVQQRVHDIGRDIASDLMRGPITDVVERQVKDIEERIAASMRSRLLEFEHDFLHTICSQDKVIQKLTCFTREAAKAAVLEEIALRPSKQDDNAGSTTVGTRNDLLRQTTERVAELEARGESETNTYWTIVQSLEVRVAGLEEEISQIQLSPVSEAAVNRLKSLEAEMATVRQRLLKGGEHARLGGIVQDPAAALVNKKPVSLGNSKQLRPSTSAAAEIEHANPVTLGPDEASATSHRDTSGGSSPFGSWRQHLGALDIKAKPLAAVSRSIDSLQCKTAPADTPHEIVSPTAQLHPPKASSPLTLVSSTPQEDDAHHRGDAVSRRSSLTSANSDDVEEILATHGLISPVSSAPSTCEAKSKPNGIVAALPPSPPSPQLVARNRLGEGVPGQQLDRSRNAQGMALGLDDGSAGDIEDGTERLLSMASSEQEFADDDDLPLEI